MFKLFLLFSTLFSTLTLGLQSVTPLYKQNIHTWPALHRAIAENRESDALEILQQGSEEAYVDIVTIDRFTVGEGREGYMHISVPRVLQTIGYYQHELLPYRTTLSLAAEYGCNAVLKCLLEMKLDPNRCYLEIEKYGGYFVWEDWEFSIYSPLACAIRAGNLEGVELLINYGANSTLVEKHDNGVVTYPNCDIPGLRVMKFSSNQLSAAMLVDSLYNQNELSDSFYRILIKHAGKNVRRTEISQEAVDLFRKLHQQMILSTQGNKIIPLEQVLVTAFHRENAEEMMLLLEYGVDPLLILTETLRHFDPQYFNLLNEYLPQGIPLSDHLLAASVSSHLQGACWMVQAASLPVLQESMHYQSVLFSNAFASDNTEIAAYLFSVGLRHPDIFQLAVESGNINMVNLVVKENQVSYEEVTEFIKTRFNKDKATARMVALVFDIQKQLKK